MGALLARLQKLEAGIANQAGRIIVVSATGEQEDGAVKAVLTEHGITVTKADDLFVFVTLYEQQDGAIEPSQGPPQLVSVHPAKRSRMGAH